MQTNSITITIPEIYLEPKVMAAVLIAMASMLVVLGLASLIRRMRQPNFAVAIKHASAAAPTPERVPPIFSSAIGSAPQSLTQRSLQELLAIEESLLAMRELYQRKLIPAEVYVSESLKYSV
jgi:hypothetical protein